MNDTAVKSDQLRVPDGTLHHEVRGGGPLVVLYATPMDADAFAPLADLLASDHTVLTTDPRGFGRSPLDDPEQECTPEQRADDLAALIDHVGGGPAAAVYGSSGGATAVLALVERHPDSVRTAIAHEPPIHAFLDDPAAHRARSDAMVATYASGDRVGAWRQFMASSRLDVPEPVFQQMFAAEPQGQARADERYQFLHTLTGSVAFVPDLDRLRTASTRLLVGLGEESAGQFCEDTSRALARRLGVEPTLFPGGHVGFAEQPEPFAARLREVLAG